MIEHKDQLKHCANHPYDLTATSLQPCWYNCSHFTVESTASIDFFWLLDKNYHATVGVFLVVFDQRELTKKIVKRCMHLLYDIKCNIALCIFRKGM